MRNSRDSTADVCLLLDQTTDLHICGVSVLLSGEVRMMWMQTNRMGCAVPGVLQRCNIMNKNSHL